MSPTTPFTFTLSFVCVLLSIVSMVRATDINIELDKRILPIPNSVTLKCTGFGNDMLNADFKIKREVNGQVTDFTDYTSSVEYDIISQPLWVASFTLTPDREGRYTCQVGQVTSSNSVVLVAYPEPDKNITASATYLATLSKDSPPIRCDFPRGSLAGTNGYYTVQWWKGSQALASWNDNVQDDSKYQVLDDFSLVVRDVTSLDASDAYYCSVVVQYEADSEVTSIGVNYELVVVGNLTLTHSLENKVLKVNETQTFSCTATGIPQISSTWLINGVPWNQLPMAQSHRYSVTQQPKNLMSDSFAQTATLTVSNAQTVDTSHVQCLFYNSKDPGTHFASSIASLIVLGAPSVPEVVADGSSVSLSVALPGVVPTAFSLSIRYLHSRTDNTIRTISVMDPSFHNMDTITDFLIPAQDLPPFMSFITSVAVEVNGVTGPYSGYSGETTYSLEDTVSCTTLSQSTSPTASSEGCIALSTFLATVFVLLFVMAMAILLLTVFFIFRAKCRLSKQQVRDGIHEQGDNVVDTHSNLGYARQSYDLTQSEAEAPSHNSTAMTLLDSPPRRIARRQSMETAMQETVVVAPRLPSDRQASPDNQYETVGNGLASQSDLPAYSTVVPSNQRRKASNVDMPAIAEVTAPLNSPSSSEPVLTAANGERGRGIAINRKESPEMVDTGTSASPPAAFSMPDLSSSMKASDLVRKSSDDSSVALRKVQATVNAKDYPETLPCITQPSPPILRSFKEVMSNSTANTKHRNSQEDSEKSEDSDELAKEYEKEYDIIHTPPDEVPAN